MQTKLSGEMNSYFKKIFKNVYRVCLAPEVDAAFVSCSILNVSIDPDSLGGGAV